SWLSSRFGLAGGAGLWPHMAHGRLPHPLLLGRGAERQRADAARPSCRGRKWRGARIWPDGRHVVGKTPRQHCAACGRHGVADWVKLMANEPLDQPLRLLDDRERFDWLRLFRCDNIGPRTFQYLLKRYGSAGAALAALPELIAKGKTSRPVTI